METLGSSVVDDAMMGGHAVTSGLDCAKGVSLKRVSWRGVERNANPVWEEKSTLCG